MGKTKLLIADRHEIFREGLARLLGDTTEIEVISTTCESWEEDVIKLQPDIILMDTEISKCSGIEAIQRIHQKLPKTKVIALTHSETKADLLSALRAGARAYISKDISLENLVRNITLVIEGEIIISPPMAASLIDNFCLPIGQQMTVEPGDDTILSKREQEILSLVAQGFTNKEIAASLVISEHTVKVHLRNIMEKLRAHTRQQAVFLAKEKDLLTEETEINAKPV